MIKYIVAIFALLALLGSGWGFWQHSRAKSLEADLQAAEARVQALTTQLNITRLSAELEARRAEKEKARADDVQRALETMLTGDLDNADIPIDPRLTLFLDCLREAGTNDSDCAEHLSGDTANLPDQ